MDKQKGINAVQQFVGLLFSDFSAAVAMTTDDFVWDNFLPPHVPFGPHYEGAAGLRTYLDELAVSWRVGDLAFHEYIYDPESKIMAVTGVEKNGKALSTGRSCNMDFVWKFQFTDAGKIRYVREYNDTFAVAQTFDRR